MRSATMGVVAALIMLSQTVAFSQSGTLPSSATDVTSADLLTVLKNAPPDAVSDQQIRVVDMGKYNVAVGVLHRSGKARQGAISHSQITEVYYIMKGAGTLVTGGTMPDATGLAPDGQTVKVLVGPSASGTSVRNGQSRKVGPGDVVVIPPGVAHWFSAVDADLDYLVVRVDADHVLPTGYVNPLLKK